MDKRLIDANKAKAVLINMSEHLQESGNLEIAGAIMYAAEVIERQKTVDAVEVVHGRWEWYTDRCEDLFLGCDDDYGWRCSKCKVPLDDEDDPEVMPTFRYCPNCGAKMDG